MSMNYNAVNAKIAAKKGRILKKINWEKILNLSQVDDLTDALKSNEELKQILSNMKISHIHRDSLEALLGKLKTLEIEDLLHYYSGNSREFMKAFLIEGEITDLSLILRKIARKEEVIGIEDRFVHSEKFTDISYKKLISSKNILQFSENLKNTPYYSELRVLTKEDTVKREFHIEMKLYFILYKSLIERAETLNKRDMEETKDIIGTKIDILNVLWIYRALNYYSISPEEIFNYSLDWGKKIKLKALKKLCYSKTLEKFYESVESLLNFDIQDKLNDINNNIAMYDYIYEYLKKNKFNNIGNSIAFIYFIDIMINDMTSITEGIKYNVPRNKLKDFLVYIT